MNGIVNPSKKEFFVTTLLKWHKKNRRDFPWRRTSDPYKILISEILLQKTRAENVVPVFNSFSSKYPDAKKLSTASYNELKNEIEILGLFNQRAAKLQKLTKILVEKYNGKVPNNKKELLELPGIGNYIANAVLCFAFGYDLPLLDTNIGRIIERVFSIKVTGEERKKDKVWEMIAEIVPASKSREYNYSLIDFGALVCTAKNPKHNLCPLAEICDYYLGDKKRNEISSDCWN
ncbi:MAG: A/G-specific adenine glycosylase [Methanophagales archaeon ANME-1-THS]|nr:MAG: A/G-specific adenine glycosylase [Methanophagales archaeon ANME-1-THS]